MNERRERTRGAPGAGRTINGLASDMTAATRYRLRTARAGAGGYIYWRSSAARIFTKGGEAAVELTGRAR